MAIDSAASLLFKIGANADDAQANIARFRTVFGQDMTQLKTQVVNWAEEVFGSSEKVRAAYEKQILAIEAEKKALLENAATAEETSRIEAESAKKAEVAQSGLQNALKSVGIGWKSIGAVAGASVAALGATLFESAKKSAELGEQMENLHDQTGMSVEMLSTLRVMAREAGVGFDQMGITAETLARNTSDLVRPTSMAARAVRALGISTTNADGTAKSADQIFLDLADALHKSGVNARTTALATSILSTSGAKLIPILARGSGAVKQAADRTRQMGEMVTEASAALSTQFLASLRDMTLELEGLVQTIGLRVMPAMTVTMKGAVDVASAAFHAFDDVIGFVSRHSDAIIQVLEAAGAVLTVYAAKMVAARIATIDFSAATGKAMVVQAFATAMSAAQTAIEAATAALKGFTIQEAAATAGLTAAAFAVYKVIDAYRQMREAQAGASAAQEQERRTAQEAEKAKQHLIAAVEKLTGKTVAGATEQSRWANAMTIARSMTAAQREELDRLIVAMNGEATATATSTAAITKHTKARRDARIEVEKMVGSLKDLKQLENERTKLDQQMLKNAYAADTARMALQNFYRTTATNVAMLPDFTQHLELVPPAMTQTTNATKQLAAALQSVEAVGNIVFDAMGKKASKYARLFQQEIMMVITSIQRKQQAEISAAATSVATSNAETAAHGKNIGLKAVWNGMFEFAKGLASLAMLDFRGAAQHFAAATAFTTVAGTVGAAVASMFSGSAGGGGRSGARASSRGSAGGSHSSSGSGGGGSSSQPQPQINVYVEGGIISADTLNQVVSQISQSVQNGQTTLPATHLIVGGAMVPAGAH